MGLLLLVPGLIFLLNQTTWFDGESAVGRILVVVGGILIALQVIWGLIVAAKARSVFRDFDRRF